MFIEYFDFRRSNWDPETLAAIVARLEQNGYHGLVADMHQVLGRYVHPQADRNLATTLAHADSFTDVLIPPAQPRARLILHRPQPDTLRVVVAGRSQQEVRAAAIAVKVHLEAVAGKQLGEMVADESGRASLGRFRREVLPSLGLTGEVPAMQIRTASATQLLSALRRMPVFRDRPTVLGSQLGKLAPDRPLEQVRVEMEQAVTAGAAERWYVVVCRVGGQWLAVSPGQDEIKTFVSLNVACPHCGKKVSEEQQDVVYRLGNKVDALLADNRWICELIENALRRLGVEAVAVQPSAGPVDGAACYYGAVILFRAKDGAAGVAEATALQEQTQRLERAGWPVFALLASNQTVSAEIRALGITVVDGLSDLDGTLEGILRQARERALAALVPPLLRPITLAVADVLPAEQLTPRESEVKVG